ncbi:MAG TPA: flagellar protein FlaG [Clostridia bacterium]|nr:flagellar protein FlaG [Clostridia bacterium]
MKIEGMDASLWQTSNVVQNQGKIDLPVKPVVPAEDQEVVPAKVSEAFIKRAVDKANQTMQEHGRSLEFRIHEKTNEVIVKIIDTDTKEVIREIPSEKILDMFANMLELAGLLVDERR